MLYIRSGLKSAINIRLMFAVFMAYVIGTVSASALVRWFVDSVATLGKLKLSAQPIQRF